MQVIGICRFSYPALGGFQVEHKTIEERSAFLYSKKRMEERFRHFETITLPSIAAQTDKDFTFLIVIGDNFPEIYHERFFDICTPVPQIVVQAYAPAPHRETMLSAMNSVRKRTGEPCLQFRHDDDDAVALNFVESFRQAAMDCKPLLKRNKFVGFDFPRGYVVRPTSEGILAEETFHPLWGVGLGVAVAPQIRRCIMNFSHARLAQNMPMISFDKPAMYLRGHNDFNDSRQRANISQPNLKLLDVEGETMIRKTFGVDANHIRSVFR